MAISFLLLEDGNYLLQENSGNIILEAVESLGPDIRKADDLLDVRSTDEIGKTEQRAAEELIPSLRRTLEV